MFRGLPAAGNFSKEKTQLFRGTIKESLVYKTSAQYRDKKFSALTYFNQMNDSAYKIVLLSTFGNTLLEAELWRDKFVLNNVISYLNKKPLLNLLEKDWRLLLKGNFSFDVPEVYKESQDEIILHYGKHCKNDLYHYGKNNRALTQIERWKGKSKKVIVNVEAYAENVPQDFTIEHVSLHLSLQMTLLKNAGNGTPE